MNATWKDCHRQFKSKPGEAQKVFNKIKKRDGYIDPRCVVDAARPKSSPIHDDFEWDDSKAAEEHRISQARTMIRSLVIIRPETDRPMRVFETVVLPPKEGVGRPRRLYQSMDEIMADPISRADLVDRAKREYLALRRRYSHLTELAKIHEAIGEVVGV